MKKLLHRWTSLAVIVSMLASFLVPASAYADSIVLQITNLFTKVEPLADADLAGVQRFTTGPITLTATIGGITDSQLAGIYYEITNMSTNAKTAITSNKAQKSGTNQIVFNNVTLTEGLNKIVLKYGTQNTVASTPGWAYYTPSTNIQNLTINNAPFVDDKIYPDSPAVSSTVNIAGDAPNATGVKIYVVGQPDPQSTFFSSNHFTVVADDVNKTSSTTTFRLTPGDNYMTFVASSDTRSYQVQKNLIYDNGNPFVFHATATDSSSTAKQLITSPVLDAATVQFDGLVKVGLDSNGNLKYKTLDIVTDGTGSPVTFNLSAMTPDATWSKAGLYNVYSISANNVTLDTNKKEQLIQFKFTDGNGISVTTSKFTVNYVDPTMPYIDHISIGNATTDLNLTGVTEINELPKDLYVYGDNNTNKVNLYLGDDLTGTPYASSTTKDTNNVFKITLAGDAPTGTMKLTAVPSTDTTAGTKTGEFSFGQKQYNVTISSVPYFILDNIYNGMVIQGPASVNCNVGGVSTDSCLHFRLVNAPSSPDIRLNVNGNIYTTTSTPAVTADTTNSGFYLIYNGTWNEGRNSVELSLYSGTNLVTQVKLDIFKFSVGSPTFNNIIPIETGTIPKYPPGQVPDTFVTKEKTVSLKGQFANASEIKVIVHSKDSNGFNVTTYDRRYKTSTDFDSKDSFPFGTDYFGSITAPNGGTAGSFATNPITLAETGDTVFEFILTNSSNSTVTKTITIGRQPDPYTIVYPVVTKNGDGDLQANINSNSIEVEMNAENAQSVLFGKEEADKRQVVVNGVTVDHYFYTVTNLKPGKNTVKFTITNGSGKFTGNLILFNTNISTSGAEYTSLMTSSIKAFNNTVQLTFPKGTSLMRNDPTAVDKFITPNRTILLGIADSVDGRIDKYKHPAAADGQVGNTNPLITQQGPTLLEEPTGHFRAVSPLIWIDAGTIAAGQTDLNTVYNGGGRLPYDDLPFYSRSRDDLVVPTQRGQLTLKYDENIREDAWRYLTVYQFDIFEDFSGAVVPNWKNIGGVVDPKNHTITVPIDTFGYFRVMYMNQSFDDVNSHPWARNDLDTLYSKGIMLNKTDNAFIPNDPISRGEFATMLVKIFDIPLQYDNNATFRDVPRVNPLGSKLYDYKYIETAARTGVVRGATLDMFFPDSALTRQDAAVMIARAANLKLSNDDNKTLLALEKLFTDADDIDIYARAAVEAISKSGLIEGKENALEAGQKKATLRFDPTETFLRSEAAAVAIRVLKQEKKIPK